MTSTEVRALAESVIVHYGLPFAVLSVVDSAAGWNIRVRAGMGDVTTLVIARGRPVAMRVAIQDKLEAAY